MKRLLNSLTISTVLAGIGHIYWAMSPWIPEDDWHLLVWIMPAIVGIATLAGQWLWSKLAGQVRDELHRQTRLLHVQVGVRKEVGILAVLALATAAFLGWMVWWITGAWIADEALLPMITSSVACAFIGIWGILYYRMPQALLVPVRAQPRQTSLISRIEAAQSQTRPPVVRQTQSDNGQRWEKALEAVLNGQVPRRRDDQRDRRPRSQSQYQRDEITAEDRKRMPLPERPPRYPVETQRYDRAETP